MFGMLLWMCSILMIVGAGVLAQNAEGTEDVGKLDSVEVVERTHAEQVFID